MKAVRLQLALRTLLNPAAPQWQKVPEEVIPLVGTPLHLQPTRYIRTAWADRLIGAVRAVRVKVAFSSTHIFFRLQWQDPNHNVDYGDGTTFPDAAAILFPINGDAPLLTMGSPDSPVNAWFWRANLRAPQNLVAHGLGSVEKAEGPPLWAQATWTDNEWHLVLARALGEGNFSAVALMPGREVKVAFAIWEGGNQERGGLKAFSQQWRILQVGQGRGQL